MRPQPTDVNGESQSLAGTVFWRDVPREVIEGKSDFAEILQCNILATEIWYDFLNLGFPLAASAGSDVPFQSGLGEVRVYAQIADGPFTPDAWFDAMKRGRTFVTNGPMLEFTVNGTPPGGEIRAQSTTETVRNFSSRNTVIVASSPGFISLMRAFNSGRRAR